MASSDLFRVRMFMEPNLADDAKVTEHITDREGAQALVSSILELHYSPGVNPHCGRETVPVWKITMAELTKKGPYWWSTPGLRNDHEKGAAIYDWGYEHTLWTRPVSVADTSVTELVAAL